MKYTSSNIMIGPYRCVAIDKDDYMVSGRYGWVFPAGKDRVGVVTLTGRGSMRTETLTYCNLRELKDHISKISVLRDPEEACYYANNPNARFETIEY